ncbi:hypothetical protein L2Y96_12760 [Luteibacter aegosomaticola]|uniref:hypothetical protein n=1 Tax=Luteibacter aegosomaticola TaxID=2911538 RepID=UPI001FFB8DF7|nr:hypothetical protein [Luteibacter aegosomaticola]UPG88291.1 hypothetical protein L2Y96_12760 [Luteibacter aegosomaticola]
MATLSVTNSLPTFLYDLYRAKGSGWPRRPFDATKAAEEHAIAEAFARDCEVDLLALSGDNRGDIDYERELGERILMHESHAARFKGLDDGDWIGQVAAAFYCKVGKKALGTALTANYGAGWKAFLITQGVAKRHAIRFSDALSRPRADGNDRILPTPAAPSLLFVWHWVRDELPRVIRPPQPGKESGSSVATPEERPAINRARVLKKKVPFVVRTNPDGSFVIEGSADGGSISVDTIVAAMREDGYQIRMFSAFDVVGMPWARSDERRVWVALVNATMDVTRDAIRLADDETLRIVLDESLPEAVAPLPPRNPL